MSRSYEHNVGTTDNEELTMSHDSTKVRSCSAISISNEVKCEYSWSFSLNIFICLPFTFIGPAIV